MGQGEKEFEMGQESTFVGGWRIGKVMRMGKELHGGK